MTNINAINYLAMNIKGNKQLGSTKEATGTKTDLTDGLSAEELKLIDKNKDGSISENEFKQTFGAQDDSYKKYWEALTEFYNSKCTKKDDGTKETSKVNGANVTSTYDKNGKLTGYTKTTVNEEGVKTVITYTVKNGVATKTKTTKVLADGTQKIVNNETNITTTKAQDGTAVSTDKKGNVKTLSTADGNTKINFAYDSKGNITKATVTINGQKITGSEVSTSKDGKTTTIKDSNGNIVAKYHTNKEGETFITAYKDGKKSKCFKLNDNNEPVYVNTLDKNGNVKKREYCETGVTRKFERDENGKVISSTDYKNGKKVSTQTYNKDGDWKTRTLYDENGNVSSYLEYSYTKNDKGVITNKTTKKYTDDTKKELVATYKDTLNKNGDKTERIVSKPNEPTETITYKYKDGELSSTSSNKGNVLKTTTYENGEKAKETKKTIIDGKETVQTTVFNYYEGTDKVQYKVITKDDGTVILCKYGKDSSLLSKIDVKKEIATLEEQLTNATDSEKEDIQKQIDELKSYL